MSIRCWFTGHELEGKITRGSLTYYKCNSCGKYYCIGYDGLNLHRFEVDKSTYKEQKELSSKYEIRTICKNCGVYNNLLFNKGEKIPAVVIFKCENCGCDNRNKRVE